MRVSSSSRIDPVRFYPQWIGRHATERAIELLQTRDNVTVFYGHIHQEHHFMTGNIAHHWPNRSFALPVAASQPKRLPIPDASCRTKVSDTARSKPSARP
jgi:hypothetical protein